MFGKIITLAALVSYAAAQGVSITLQTPTNWQSGTQANISWSTTDTTTRFSLELVNPGNFHNSFGIGTNIDPTLGFLSFTLPVVPAGDGYMLEAINVTDINTVYGSSGQFSIAQTPSTVSSSTTASSSSTLSSASLTSSGSSVSTVSGSSTSAAPSSTAPSSSGTSSAAASTGSSFNGSPARFDFSLGSWAVMAVGAVAGAVVAL